MTKGKQARAQGDYVLDEVSPEQRAAITAMLREEFALECDVIGNARLNQLASGEGFATTEGGRNLEFVDLISGLASFATLIHAAFVVRKWQLERAAKSKTDDVPVFADESSLAERLKEYPNLRVLSERDPKRFARIVSNVSRHTV